MEEFGERVFDFGGSFMQVDTGEFFDELGYIVGGAGEGGV